MIEINGSSPPLMNNTSKNYKKTLKFNVEVGGSSVIDDMAKLEQKHKKDVQWN